MFDNKNQLSLAGTVFVACLIIVAIGSLTGLDFGWVGIIAWIVVIVGAIFFVLTAINEATK